MRQAATIDDMRGGGWWMATKKARIVCPHCGERISDWPMVSYYRPELDHGRYNAKKHPGWPDTRWLANWEHGWWQGQMVVTEAVVKRWMRRYGPFNDR